MRSATLSTLATLVMGIEVLVLQSEAYNTNWPSMMFEPGTTPLVCAR